MGNKLSLSQLRRKANHVREDVIRMLAEAGSGHTAGSLDLADIVTSLYFNIMNIDPNNPTWAERDIFILSNVNCFNMAKTHNNHSLEAKNNAIYSQCHPFTCSRLGNFSL